MTERNFRRIRALHVRVNKALADAKNLPDHESLNAFVRAKSQEVGLAGVTFVHQQARRMLAANEPDTILPNQFDGVLKLLQTQEQVDSKIRAISDEDVPRLETFYKWMLHEVLPSAKDEARWIVKAFPNRPRGGRKSLLPKPETCRQICLAISALKDQRVAIGDAQRQIVAKYRPTLKLSFRTVERIWADRDKYLALPPP